MSRPYNHTLNFLETAHFQSIELNNKLRTWAKTHYYDDRDMLQKLSPNNFHSNSHFAEVIAVEEINLNNNVDRMQIWDDADKH